MLVVGVSLIAVPTDAPAAHPSTHVDGVRHGASPSSKPSPSASAQPLAVTADAASPTIAVQIAAEGPSTLHLWQKGVYTVTFTVSGTQSAAVWWSGARMQDWSWQLVDGHCEMTPSQDRLAGSVIGGRAVIQLDLTPMSTGQLVVQGSVNGGPPLGLAVVQVS